MKASTQHRRWSARQAHALLPHWQHQRLLQRCLWRVVELGLAGIVAVGVLTLEVGETRGHGSKEGLPLLGAVPQVTLVERSGQPLSTADLQGEVWIANFIFTRCIETCPVISSRMAQLQKAFATEDEARLVSITVDPAHDTPEVLARYADKIGAHPQRWLFLTGKKEHIYRLARQGFRMGVKDPYDDKHSSAVPVLRHLWEMAQHVLLDFEPTVAWAHDTSLHEETTARAIQHSERFVLVDRQGQIRHYYNSRDTAALQRLHHHVRLLLRER